jgi:hypothetical protein
MAKRERNKKKGLEILAKRKREVKLLQESHKRPRPSSSVRVERAKETKIAEEQISNKLCENDNDGKSSYHETGRKLSPVARGSRDKKRKKNREDNTLESIKVARKSAPMAIGSRKKHKSDKQGHMQTDCSKKSNDDTGWKLSPVARGSS